MELKYRKLISQCKSLHKALRWIAYNSSWFLYHKLAKENDYKSLFASMKASKKGKRCFIIGNGPSLQVHDLEMLKNEDSFAANEIHRCFTKTKWRPTYYLIMDRYSKSTPEEIKDIECKFCFLGSYYWCHNNVLRNNAICLFQHYNMNDNQYEFSSDISKYIIVAPTVSYASMQIAAYLGYSEIYLLGFDHNYSFEFDRKGKVIQTGQNSTHFYKDDIAEDIIGDVWGMTKAYETFRDYAETNGIKVYNATRGGKLNVFNRIDFDSLF